MIIALAVLVAGARNSLAQERARTTAVPPRLVVFLAIDQMRGDYIDRFAPQLTGGLKRLSQGGAFFTNAVHDHAVTQTAPGHASMLSGRFPVHTGIRNNAFGVPDSTVTIIGAPGEPGASPHRFRGTTLVDWIVAAHPRARILSVSRKDRSAILPVGRSRSPVFWYDDHGNFSTSTYYADTLPAWLQRFNARKLPASYVGREWTPLLAADAYAETQSGFPHLIRADSLGLEQLAATPFIDKLTLDAALAGVRAMNLGAGPQTDFLSVSLSGTDGVGHAYGPDSKEVHDQILRVDRYVGEFLDSLFKLRDPRTVVIAFTGDHGVGPRPGTPSRDPNAGAQFVNLGPLIASTRAQLQARGVPPTRLRYDGVVSIDRGPLQAAGINPDSLLNALRDSALKIPGVMRIDRIAELQKADTVKDQIARRWLHMFDTDSVAALVVTLAPYNYSGVAGAGTGATHGSPYDYDAHVPVIFYGAPFKPGRYGQRVRVVDLAPTVAAAIGVRPTERLDGRVLTAALRTPVRKDR
jgi:predicted AlkP superfamily pyrophosphatase or phosphodiesterase